MKKFISNVYVRYKIEALLSIVSVIFFAHIISPEFYKNKWDSLGLRTMMFTLFGLVGLIGLSLSVKRHEQTLAEHREFILGKSTERMHDCIQHLSNSSPFPVFLGALRELETLFEKLNKENQELLMRGISSFIQSKRVWSPNNMTTPVTARATEEHLEQNRKLTFAYRTLNKLSRNQPIDTLKKYQIDNPIDLTEILFEGTDMGLDGANLGECSFNGATFRDTKIINCVINNETIIKIEAFQNVRIDGTDFAELRGHQNRIDALLRNENPTLGFYYSDKNNPPKNMHPDKEKEAELLRMIYKDPSQQE